MNDTPYVGPDRRQSNGDLETVAEDAACRASKKVLGEFTDHDLSTKDGRGELRSDLRHLTQTRVGTEDFRKNARRAAITTAISGGVGGICYAIWQAVAPHLKP